MFEIKYEWKSEKVRKCYVMNGRMAVKGEQDKLILHTITLVRLYISY